MKPLVIGVTGGSGSGKTTIIRELKQRFKPSDVCFISQDDYYRPRDEQEMDEQGIRNFDLPRSIHKEELVQDIQRLMTGETVTRQEYTFNNEKTNPRMLIFRPAPILVVEGIFIFHFLTIRQLLDLKVFIHAKENLKVIRRIKRDQVERNYPLEDVLYRYEHHVLPTFEKYIKPYMDDADIIINNNEHFGRALNVISGYISQYLYALKKRNEGELMEKSDLPVGEE